MTDLAVRDDDAPPREQRLDALPFNAHHRRLVIGSGLGWALDAMDVGLTPAS